jgi:predicted trehalose synthase
MRFSLPKNLVAESLASFSEGVHPEIEVYGILSRTSRYKHGM